MLKTWKIVAAVASSAGVFAVQHFAVQADPPRRVAADEIVRVDELKDLAASLMPSPAATLEIEDPIARPAPAAAPELRRGAFVQSAITVPNSTVKRSATAQTERVAKHQAARQKQASSSLMRSASPISSALRQNFYSKSNFGFSGKVTKTAQGKKVRTVRKNGN